MPKAISIMAISKKRPLENFIPALKVSCGETVLPMIIPMMSANNMALNPNHFSNKIAPTAIASVSDTPLAILENETDFKGCLLL